MKSPASIVIGGGVIGLSTAYHLALRQSGPVIVLEKGLVGDGSSSRAAGIIAGLLWSEPGVLARKKGLELYRELSSEHSAYGYRFRDVGCLNLFDPASWPERSALLPLYERCGAPFEILDASEMNRRWPAHGHRQLLGIETAGRAEYRVPTRDWPMSAVSAAPELKDTLRHNFSALAPALAQAEWETEKVGLLTFSMDGEPILGPVDKFPGQHVAMVFHSGGFAYNPVAGYLMAQYVLDGRTSIDVSTFSPNRFDPTAVDAYLATTVAQQDAVRRRH